MLEQATQNALKTIQKSQNMRPTLAQKEISTLQSISSGTAFVSGLAQAQMNELLIFNKKYRVLVQTMTEQGVGVVFLDNPETTVHWAYSVFFRFSVADGMGDLHISPE